MELRDSHIHVDIDGESYDLKTVEMSVSADVTRDSVIEPARCERTEWLIKNPIKATIMVGPRRPLPSWTGLHCAYTEMPFKALAWSEVGCGASYPLCQDIYGIDSACAET